MTAQFMFLVERYYARWWRRQPSRVRTRPAGPCVYVWVAENASGQHCIHWVVNLPADRRPDFVKRLPGWVAKIAGIVQPGAIDIVSVHNAAGLRKYLLKGCEPAYAAFCKIDFEDQGDIVGKRCGVSRSLQRTERERQNYRSRRFRYGSPAGTASPSGVSPTGLISILDASPDPNARSATRSAGDNCIKTVENWTANLNLTGEGSAKFARHRVGESGLAT